jgi:hypothetical protein
MMTKKKLKKQMMMMTMKERIIQNILIIQMMTNINNLTKIKLKKLTNNYIFLNLKTFFFRSFSALS